VPTHGDYSIGEAMRDLHAAWSWLGSGALDKAIRWSRSPPMLHLFGSIVLSAGVTVHTAGKMDGAGCWLM
jgi:hypothetical protein